MNISIIGPGALGCLFAGRLAQGGERVSLFDHRPERAAALANQLQLSSAGVEQQIDIAITADPAIVKEADVLLLCVKSHQVEAALQQLKPFVRPESLVVGLQNGISHLPLFAAERGFYALGVTAQGATLQGPGRVVHGGHGPTFVGYPSPQQDGQRLKQLSETLSRCQLPCELVDDIHLRLWRKLLINVGINGLTVLYDCPNGELLNIAEARQRLQKLVEEGQAVAVAQGITLTDDPVQLTLEVCQATASNISSMLQDARAGRTTEIRAINGALAQLATSCGVATPENDLLVKQVMEKTEE